MRSQELPKKSPTLECGKKPRNARLKFDVYTPQAQNANCQGLFESLSTCMIMPRIRLKNKKLLKF